MWVFLTSEKPDKAPVSLKDPPAAAKDPSPRAKISDVVTNGDGESLDEETIRKNRENLLYGKAKKTPKQEVV